MEQGTPQRQALRKTVDFLLTAKRDLAAAKRFFDKAMEANCHPNKVANDKSGADMATINAINAGCAVPIIKRQSNTSST